MRVPILFNPSSGRGRGQSNLQRLRTALEAAGHEVEPIAFQDALRNDDWTHRLVGAGAFVVIGGDGTVNFAAEHASEHDVPLHQFPMGTENLFAREFGMCDDPAKVLASIARGTVRRVDVAHIQGRAFVIMASFGPDASVIHRLDARRNGSISHLSYTGPILDELFSFTVAVHTVEVDGEVLAKETPCVVVVANCRQYGGRLDPAREADMTDGELDVVVLPYRTRTDLVRWVIRLWRGAHLRDPRCTVKRGRRIRVARHDTPICCQIDGEAFRPAEASAHSVEIDVAAGRLPVLAPPDVALSQR